MFVDNMNFGSYNCVMKTKYKVILVLSIGIVLLFGILRLVVLRVDNKLSDDMSHVVTEYNYNSSYRYWKITAGPANAWLLSVDDGYLLIDSGYPEDYEQFKKGMEHKNLDISQIRYIFITHHHDDHVGFISRLKEETNAHLILSDRMLPNLAKGRFEWDGMSINPQIDMLGKLYNIIKKRDFSFEPVIPDSSDTLLNGTYSDIPREWGLDGSLYYTPGHSVDSWSLILDNGLAFVGDAAMNMLTNFGSGYRPIFLEDRYETYRSFDILKDNGAEWILTGHGEPFGVEKLPEFLEVADTGPGLKSLGSYLFRLLPGFVLIILLLILLGKGYEPLRITLYITSFILMRDLMTTFGFWSFGNSPVFWLRFAADGSLLLVLGIGSIIITGLMIWNEKRIGNNLTWIKNRTLESIGAGVVGTLIVVLPMVLIYTGILKGERGGVFPSYLLPALLFISLSGNFLEEVIFRGYLQKYLNRGIMTESMAALSSGLLFGIFHLFLAYTVTDVGIGLILFATYEGIICGFINKRYGLVAAILTHGLAVCTLSFI